MLSVSHSDSLKIVKGWDIGTQEKERKRVLKKIQSKLNPDAAPCVCACRRVCACRHVCVHVGVCVHKGRGENLGSSPTYDPTPAPGLTTISI